MQFTKRDTILKISHHNGCVMKELLEAIFKTIDLERLR